MRPFLAPLLALGLALAARSAPGVELDLGWSARAAWESNIFYSTDDEESDFSLLTGPEVRVRERTRALDFDLGYRVLYEEFLQRRGLGSFQHFQDLTAVWRPTARDTFLIDQDFARTASVVQLVEAGATGVVSPQLVEDRDPITRNEVNGTYRRQLGPLWSLDLTGSNSAYWYDTETRSDSISTSGSIDAVRFLSERHRVGAGFALTRQDFSESEFSNGTGTTFYQVYGIWNWEVQQTTSLSVSIGPRLAQPDDFDEQSRAPANPVRGTGFGTFVVSPVGCPSYAPGVVRFTDACAIASGVRINPNSVSVRDFDFLEAREQPGSTLGFFGRISLVKRWRQASTLLSYERSASSSAGLAASTDLDVLRLQTEWTPRRAWTFTGIASWERQVQATEIPTNELLLSTTPTTLLVDARGNIVTDPSQATQTIPNAAQTIGLRTAELVDDAIDIQTLRFELRARRQLTPRLSVSGMAMWWRQESEGQFSSGDPVDDLRFELTLDWRFAPIEL